MVIIMTFKLFLPTFFIFTCTQLLPTSINSFNINATPTKRTRTTIKSIISVHQAIATTKKSNNNSDNNIITENNDNNNNDSNLETFINCLQSMSLSQTKQNDILNIIRNTLEFTSSNELYIFAIDFVHRPEILSQILINDFGISVAKSHLIRGCLIKLVQIMDDHKYDDIKNADSPMKSNDNDKKNDDAATSTSLLLSQRKLLTKKNNDEKQMKKQPLFKSVIVNTKAKKRMTKTSSNNNDNNYGIALTLFPKLAIELDEFLLFMIQPSTKSSQESPIRESTATVYIRHAKLFLGWWTKYQYMQYNNNNNNNNINNGKKLKDISIFDIFPHGKASAAQPVIDFILWLRDTRDISSSYEANLLRGLTKLLKFRFCQESESDPSYGEKSFSDIKAVNELRKLHRDANRRQLLCPRSSEEDKKWLDWNDFLDVIKAAKEELSNEIFQWEQQEEKRYQQRHKKKLVEPKLNGSEKSPYTPIQRRIASKFQAYLILAFFSCVPDRQRTFRELELEKTFLKDSSINCWTIKHGPDDYKTGSTYGERPPLVIAEELTPAIDDFLNRWRQCLSPSGNHFFVQQRTGHAFTQDTVYSIVARTCYKYKGKKTNPHLLRDMIVTKIRDSNASEKELEALALYMGHSINMQRTSYDRRTMKQKVAPAVQLLQSVNRSVNK